jgi:hypothetical protein
MTRCIKLDAAKMGINLRDGLPNGRSISCTVFVLTAIRTAPRRTGRLQTGIVDSGTSNMLQPTISPPAHLCEGKLTVGHLAYAERRIEHNGRYRRKDENLL